MNVVARARAIHRAKVSRVTVYHRFDLDESARPVLTDAELKRRWESFHAAIRSTSHSILKRTAGRLLGEGTLRYQLPKALARPLTRLARQHRPTPSSPTPIATENPTPFPADYRPAHGECEVQDVDASDVLTVVINESTTGSAAVVDSLNHTVATSHATWLLILDASTSAHDRVTATAHLRSHCDDVADVVYADESGLDERAPLFKPARIGPHTLLSYNVVGRPALVRMSTLRRLGGFDAHVGWAFEHDAYLRILEADGSFRHVPLVLPSGRPPIAFQGAHIDADTCSAIRAAFVRRGWRGRVDATDVAGLVRWDLETPSPPPSIDIIIPTRDRVDLLRACIASLESTTTYANYRITILDNDSRREETLAYLAATSHRVVPCPGPFNYARIMNRGVEHSDADFVVTLNNDTTVVTADWLEKMVSLAALDDVGIVGGRLLDQHGRSEHESIVIAPYPQHLRTDSNYPRVDQFSRAVRDVAAVTGALQMVPRELWRALGGMDEGLKVTMNDVDLCLRSQNEGREVVYRPDVTFNHHASSSRGGLDPVDDRNRFVRRWDIFGSFRDPYFPESFELLGQTIHFRPR